MCHFVAIISGAYEECAYGTKILKACWTQVMSIRKNPDAACVALSGHPKTGQRWSGQNRPTEEAGDSVVLSCNLVWRQVYFCAPASRTAFEYVSVMQQAVEHGSDGGAVSQQLPPVVHGSVRCEQRTGAF